MVLSLIPLQEHSPPRFEGFGTNEGTLRNHLEIESSISEIAIYDGSSLFYNAGGEGIVKPLQPGFWVDFFV